MPPFNTCYVRGAIIVGFDPKSSHLFSLKNWHVFLLVFLAFALHTSRNLVYLCEHIEVNSLKTVASFDVNDASMALTRRKSRFHSRPG